MNSAQQRETTRALPCQHRGSRLNLLVALHRISCPITLLENANDHKKSGVDELEIERPHFTPISNWHDIKFIRPSSSAAAPLPAACSMH